MLLFMVGQYFILLQFSDAAIYTLSHKNAVAGTQVFFHAALERGGFWVSIRIIQQHTEYPVLCLPLFVGTVDLKQRLELQDPGSAGQQLC